MSLLLQLVVNALAMGSVYALITISFGLVYGVTRTFHVAHAGLFTAAGYVLWILVEGGMPFPLGIVVTIVVTAALGALIQRVLYQPLSRRRATPLVVMIASLGLLAVIDNLVTLFFTTNLRFFTLPALKDSYQAGDVIITLVQIADLVVAVVAAMALLWFLNRHPLGQVIRAVASNPQLALLNRIDPFKTYLLVYAIASAIVAMAGMLNGMDFGVRPYWGFIYLLTATVAMIAGGIGSVQGAFMASYLIALLQNVTNAVLPGEWSVAVTFAIFIVIILWRPQGLFAEAS